MTRSTTGISRRQFARGAALAALSMGSRAAVSDAGPAGMRIAILGTSVAIPDPGCDSACFLINGKHLVDTGWGAALKMRQYGFDPLALESVVLTHFHQDHYLGLPQLLFHIGLKRSDRPLTIAGPAEHLERMLRIVDEFLQVPRFPELKVNYTALPLAAGDSFARGDLRFETMAALHVSGKKLPESALAYKVTDARNGACVVYSGDTSRHPPLADFAKGAPLLIHDSAHTSARDAADIALRAGVTRLALIHYGESRAGQLLKEAQAVFPNTVLAREGETLDIPAVR